MEIRDQMTATVRLTKSAAIRLSMFAGSLKIPPKNMNDLLNLALSDIPIGSFIDEITALQKDCRKSLLDISARYRSDGLLKRSDYYFVVLMAKQAAGTSKKERVHHRSVQAVAEMTLDLWDLCKDADKGGHRERYMLGNLGGGNDLDPASQTLETHIPGYIEQSKNYPYPTRLEFALRNLEVMLRDDLIHIDDVIVHKRLHKYFDILHGMAVRCLFLKEKQPLIASNDQEYFRPNFSGNFGSKGMLHFIHAQDKNFSFMIAFEHINIAANNIVESEEFFDAFTPLNKLSISYKGENFSLMHENDCDNDCFNGGVVFATRMFKIVITREEYDKASKAIADMLADTRVQAALGETYQRFGTL